MIDGGIFVGRNATSDTFVSANDALAKLKRLGVSRALSASFRAIYFDYKEGNREMIEDAATSGGALIPMAVINPAGYEPGGAYLSEIKAAGAAVAALFPTLGGWNLKDYVLRQIFKDAARADLPVQVTIASRADLTLLADYSSFGGLVLARWLGSGGYNALPDIAAIANEHPTMLLDIGNITQSGGYRWLIDKCGDEKFFLASHYPLGYEATPYFILHGSDLPEESRRKIGGANLARSLKLPEPKTATKPSQWDSLVGRRKIDTHWHTSGWNIIEPRIHPALLSAEFTKYRYDLVCSSSIRALSDDIIAGNAETLEFLSKDRRARGLVVINPLQIEASIGEIEKYRNDLRFVGVKTIQDFYGVDLNCTGYRAIFDHLKRYNDWPVMAHLPGMREIALAMPELQFLAAHSTWRYHDLADLPNIWYDIATSTNLRAATDIRGLIDLVGDDKVIFSCDGQLMSPAWTLGKLACLDLSDDQIDKILYRNALCAFPRLSLVIAGEPS